MSASSEASSLAFSVRIILVSSVSSDRISKFGVSSLESVSAVLEASYVAVLLLASSMVSSDRISAFGVSSLDSVSAALEASSVAVLLLESSTSTLLGVGVLVLTLVPVSVWMKFGGGTGREAGIILWGRGSTISGSTIPVFGREDASPMTCPMLSGGLTAESGT